MALANRLIRHDRLLASRLVAACFATWRDRVTLGLAIPLLLAVLYDRLAVLPPENARYVCGFVACALAFSAAKVIASRLDFFRTESVVAMDALRPASAWRYAVAWAGVASLLVLLLSALLNPGATAFVAAGLLAGFGIGSLLSFGTGLALMPRRPAALLVVRCWLRRPVAGIAMALLFCVLGAVAALAFDPKDRIALAGIAAALLALPLAGADPAEVRFMALSGFGAWRSVWQHVRGLLIFTGIAVPAGAFVAGVVGLGIVAAIGATLLVVLALRVLAYRSYNRRFADFIVTIFLLMLAMTAFAMPVALPLAVAVTGWWLWRRARSATWLVA